jgi:hypothetical protein
MIWLYNELMKLIDLISLSGRLAFCAASDRCLARKGRGFEDCLRDCFMLVVLVCEADLDLPDLADLLETADLATTAALFFVVSRAVTRR